jgi:hypothetical protein
MWARFVGGREERGESGGGPRPGWWAVRREAGGVRLGHAGRKGQGGEGWVFFSNSFSFLFISNLFKPKILKLNSFKLFKIFKTF